MTGWDKSRVNSFNRGEQKQDNDINRETSGKKKKTKKSTKR